MRLTSQTLAMLSQPFHRSNCRTANLLMRLLHSQPARSKRFLDVKSMLSIGTRTGTCLMMLRLLLSRPKERQALRLSMRPEPSWSMQMARKCQNLRRSRRLIQMWKAKIRTQKVSQIVKPTVNQPKRRSRQMRKATGKGRDSQSQRAMLARPLSKMMPM